MRKSYRNAITGTSEILILTVSSISKKCFYRPVHRAHRADGNLCSDERNIESLSLLQTTKGPGCRPRAQHVSSHLGCAELAVRRDRL